MVAKFTRLTHKIAIQLNLMAEGCTSCSSRSRRTVRKLLDTLPYLCVSLFPHNKRQLTDLNNGDVRTEFVNVISMSNEDEMSFLGGKIKHFQYCLDELRSLKT